MECEGLEGGERPACASFIILQPNVRETAWVMSPSLENLAACFPTPLPLGCAGSRGSHRQRWCQVIHQGTPSFLG